MKKVIIKILKLYQLIPGNFHNACRHIPTCSEYAIIAVERFGSAKGLYLTFKRVMKCNPLGSKGIDLVPERIKK